MTANVNYTYSKNLQWTTAPDIFNPALAQGVNYGKDVVGANPPQQLRISFEYRVPRYRGSMPVLKNKIVSQVLAGLGHLKRLCIIKPWRTLAVQLVRVRRIYRASGWDAVLAGRS